MSDIPQIPEQCVDVSGVGDKGVMKLVIKDGVGGDTPLTNDKVSVHYTGTLFGGDNHGNKFDSSRDRNSPFEFTLGKGTILCCSNVWCLCILRYCKTFIN